MDFKERLWYELEKQERFLSRKNHVDQSFYNGIYERYENPVLTRDSVPLSWRYDFSEERNPFFMERLVRQYDGVDSRDTARYGRMLALTSSLVFAGIMLADIVYIFPETADTQLSLYRQLYGEQMDANMRSALKTIEDNYPKIMFFSTLIYSWLYGVILSAVLSLTIPGKDPFSRYMNKQGGHPDE